MVVKGQLPVQKHMPDCCDSAHFACLFVGWFVAFSGIVSVQ
jgi:hypothetical protein